jgi:site-specific recombinase XerD
VIQSENFKFVDTITLRRSALSAMTLNNNSDSEAAALKTLHIDSKSMRVFVDAGKGGKDRYTLLSKACLVILTRVSANNTQTLRQCWLFEFCLGTTNETLLMSECS